MLKQELNRLIREYDSEILWIEAWGENSLRVRVTNDRRMPVHDEEWALFPPVNSAVQIKIDGNEAVIINGKITAHLTGRGKIIFLNQKGEVLLEEYHRNRREIFTETKDTNHDLRMDRQPGYLQTIFSELDIEAREFNPIPGSDYQLTVRFEANENEKLFGMGQYQQPYLNITAILSQVFHS
jgi:alpha-D-xyloside xylohydrolase